MQIDNKCYLSILFFCIAVSTDVKSEPSITEQYRYYSVVGSTPQLIRQSMNAQRRGHVKGGYDAYVSWFLNWHFSYDDDLRGCRITTVASDINVSYTLPLWADREQASSQTKVHWKKYYDALLAHEYGHRDWGVRAAKSIEQKLLAMDYERDCLVLRMKAQRVASRVLANYLRQENRYDRDTRHGATQGAAFP